MKEWVEKLDAYDVSEKQNVILILNNSKIKINFVLTKGKSATNPYWLICPV